MSLPLNKEFDFYGICHYCFKIGDYIYEVIEDESDGYRSSMQDVRMADNTESLIFFKTPIAKVMIVEAYNINVARKRDDFEGYHIVDTKFNHIWLEFGTSNYNDYYPCFEFHYSPIEEAMLELLSK